MVRQSSAVPSASTLQRMTGSSVLVLPLNRFDDQPETFNETLHLKTYIDAIKTITAYLLELSTV
ncbi:unnamed protein product [Anisakis simplex]|uniref:Uncharacterized protein n=1 Tax=Anisakis simplex TaxID=6269 RepID=A0A3P6SF00_ANISI|nr:unnamed protein product [Anisakis simplex]